MTLSAAPSSPSTADAARVVDFWISAGPSAWFTKNDAFDRSFRERFLDLHLACAQQACESWLAQPDSALALILLLDQFPRNAFRGTPHMFGTDPLARKYAHQILQAGLDQQTDESVRAFLYLPFEHAESLEDQALSMQCFNALGGDWVAYAVEHQDIIQRFGRFPHRNAILGRTSTKAEEAFLTAGGFSG